MAHDGFRIPDRVFFVLAGVTIGLTWLTLIWFYPSLPAAIPTHFSVTGQPDVFTSRTWWTVFFPGLLQLILSLGLGLLYWKPRYANIPGTLLLDLFDEPTKAAVIRLIHHSLVITMVLMNLIFAYLALSMVMVAFGVGATLNGWLVGGLVVLLVLVNIVYAVWTYRLTQTYIRRHRPAPPA